MADTIPDYQDEVKHKITDVTGVVIAIYEIDGIIYFDVRDNDTIHYQTPANNWITVVPVDE